MLEFAFGVAAAIAVLLTGAILAGVAVPGWRFWPPGERSWKLYANWALVLVFDAALAAVIYLDYDAWALPRHPAVVAAAGTLSLSGVALAFYSGRFLEPEETMGLAGHLHTEGPYARSRNPQYVGLILALLGVVLLANSAFATVLCLTNVAWLVLRAFAEERWLASEFGTRYDRYREEVPRFVGVRSLRGGRPRRAG